MKKIKVLHVIKSLVLGGAESNLCNMVRFSDKSQMDIHVAYSGEGGFEGILEGEGAKLFKYAKKPHRVASIQSFFSTWKLLRYIKKNNIDIVHSHNYTSHVWAALAARMARVKLLEHVHDPRFESREFIISRGLSYTNFEYAKYLSRLSDRIVVLTKANEDFVLKYNIVPRQKLIRQLNGINLHPMQWPAPEHTRRKLDLPSDKRIVLSALRLSAEKNAKLILGVAELVKDRISDVLFVIAGDGPQMNELKQEIKNRGLTSQVRLIGFYPYVLELLTMSKIFILPTLRELHSISMIEAMSARVPVLVSQGAGCNDEFINNGEDGFVLNPFDARPWADAIINLLNDESYRQKIGNAGRLKIEQQCDIHQVVDRFLNIYKEILSE